LSDLEDSILLGCCVALNGKQLLRFQGITESSDLHGQVVKRKREREKIRRRRRRRRQVA
jgi:hypothetical protein